MVCPLACRASTSHGRAAANARPSPVRHPRRASRAETHPAAPFVNFFVVSILLPSGARRTLGYSQALGKEEGGRKLAKIWTKEGVKGDEYDVDWIPFETGPIGDVLRREFWGRS